MTIPPVSSRVAGDGETGKPTSGARVHVGGPAGEGQRHRAHEAVA